MTYKEFLIENYRTMPFEFYQNFVYMLSGKHVQERAKTLSELLSVLKTNE
jgi:hypothetical protein